MFRFVLHTFLYMVDGASYVMGIYLLITSFFGYAIKNPKKTKIIGFIASIVYGILCGILSESFLAGEKTANITGVAGGSSVLAMLGIFLTIFWLVLLRYKKGKAFLIILSALQIYSVFRSLICSLQETIGVLFQLNTWGEIVVALAVSLLPLLIILLFSKMSCRRRKEEMSLFLVVWTFVVFLLFEEIFMSLILQEAVDTGMFVRFILRYDWEQNRSIFSFVMDCVMTVVILLSLFLMIKASESMYFRRKNEENERYLETQKDYYERVMKSDMEIRRIKHDMKNHIFCLSELNRTGNYEDLQKYMDELMDDISRADPDIHVGNMIADAIISEKSRIAEQNGIHIEAEGNLSGLQLSALDTCTIFANALDNALEATKEYRKQLSESKNADSQSSVIRISIQKSHNFILICVENPVGQVVKIKDNQIRSTKEDKVNHGFGINGIRKALSHYDGELELLSYRNEPPDEDGETEKAKQGCTFLIRMIIPFSEKEVRSE